MFDTALLAVIKIYIQPSPTIFTLNGGVSVLLIEHKQCKTHWGKDKYLSLTNPTDKKENIFRQLKSY